MVFISAVSHVRSAGPQNVHRFTQEICNFVWFSSVACTVEMQQILVQWIKEEQTNMINTYIRKSACKESK